MGGGRVQVGEKGAGVASPEISLNDDFALLCELGDNVICVVLDVGNQVVIGVVRDHNLYRPTYAFCIEVKAVDKQLISFVYTDRIAIIADMCRARQNSLKSGPH